MNRNNKPKINGGYMPPTNQLRGVNHGSPIVNHGAPGYQLEYAALRHPMEYSGVTIIGSAYVRYSTEAV